MSATQPARVEFIDNDRPGLPDGDYEITVTQNLSTDATTIRGQNKIPDGNQFTAVRSFSVAGPRFSLDPSVVRSVFPPAGSTGDHGNVLPHILFNRTTLPWERLARDGDDANPSRPPWLLLLLFDAEQAPATQVIPLSALGTQSAGQARFPTLELEQAQHPDDKVTVIDVPFELLETLIPPANDLVLLAHVRQAMDKNDQKTGELAAVISNRLPRSNGESVVHLVSVEERFNGENFDFQDAKAGDLIRLVSLYSWRFSCAESNLSFDGLLKNLDRNPATLRLLPVDHAEAEAYLEMGFVPVRYHLRDGSQDYAWYHSPFTPGFSPIPESPLPVRMADELLRYDRDSGFLDISYAAAWELGRLLMLQSKPTSKSLFAWKRQLAHAQHLADQAAQRPHLPTRPQASEQTPPTDVLDWFSRLRNLEGVPFQYLVPDESMLPPESIRFIALDLFWVDCLLDGAASIGRVSDQENERDARILEILRPEEAETLVSGFLLRSQVVAGWPDLLADAFDIQLGDDDSAETTPLKSLRFAHLGPDVLLALYQGKALTVDIYQKPEALHFGLDRDKDAFSKKLRDEHGVESDRYTISPIPWRGEASDRMIDITQFASDMKSKVGFKHASSEAFTPAQFAMEMIEGVKKVRFGEY